MNELETKMIEILKEVKKNNSAVAVKADFEAEGSRLNEVFWLKKIAAKAGLNLTVKIGGCQAIENLLHCKLVDAGCIMAPMVESSFAVEKFKCAAKRVYGNSSNKTNWAINAETTTAAKNFDDILKQGEGFLKSIVVGRVDLSNCMGLGRNEINSEEVLNLTLFFAEKSIEKGFEFGIGGGLSEKSFNFVSKLKNYLTTFETRKLVFNYHDDFNIFKSSILKATEFELLWMKNKSELYSEIAMEDETRIKLLNDRLNGTN